MKPLFEAMESYKERGELPQDSDFAVTIAAIVGPLFDRRLFPKGLIGWNHTRRPLFALMAATLMAGSVSAQTMRIKSTFESVGTDRRAIQVLLDTYAKAVSTKDEVLFETLLLNKAIPFCYAESAIQRGFGDGGTQNYEEFRKSVFGGPPLRQTFREIRIQQDGPLAQPSLVYVNTDGNGTSWGWKTLQLLKINGRWKIASEFYTFH